MLDEKKMRAKMRVSNVRENEDSEILDMVAVSKGAYEGTGEDENNTFALFTPQADLSMVIMNPVLMGTFEIGQEFYLDFIAVDGK